MKPSLVIRPWKSRIVQTLAFLALGIWPNVIAWQPPFSATLAAITLLPAVWIAWRVARAEALVYDDGSALVDGL